MSTFLVQHQYLNLIHFRRRKTHDDPNFLSNVIYENYDESGEFFDYEYDDNWHHKPQSEDIWKNVENERKFPKKYFENKNHNFNTRNDHSRQAEKYRRLEGGKSPATSLYRDILQSKIRGQPTSTFKGDWVKPHQTRTQKHKRKSSYPSSKATFHEFKIYIFRDCHVLECPKSEAKEGSADWSAVKGEKS